MVGARSRRNAGSISSTSKRLKNLVSFSGNGPLGSAELGLKDPGRVGVLLELVVLFREEDELDLLCWEVLGSELSPATFRPL